MADFNTYVVGFLFNEARGRVVLMKKDRGCRCRFSSPR